MTTPRHGRRHQHDHAPSFARWTARGSTPWLVGAALCAVLLPGCVSVEKYESEKTRALNFQRLLAQEENRADELNVQVQELKIKMGSMESGNDEMAGKLKALREQASQQTSPPAMHVPATPDAEEGSDDMSFSQTSLSELGLPDLSFEESAFQGFDGDGDSVYHTVVEGETLYRLSRNYGVTIAQLKAWNNLTGDLISIGQRLIVSTP